jgi:hypothetical protein
MSAASVGELRFEKSTIGMWFTAPGRSPVDTHPYGFVGWNVKL